MQDKEIAPLISMLDDGDEAIAAVIMEQLCSRGEVIMPQLEQAWHSCYNETQLLRIERVMADIQGNIILKKIAKWVDSGTADLFKGIYYLTKLLHPDITYGALSQKLDDICRDIWVEISGDLSELEKVRIINYVLFDKYKFYHNIFFCDVESFLLDDLLQSKKGNLFSLSLLYLCVAERLHLPIKGVDIPGSILLAYIDGNSDGGERKLFYIYPFLYGQILEESHIGLFCNRREVGDAEKHKFLRTCSNQTQLFKTAQALYALSSKHKLYAERAERLQVAVEYFAKREGNFRPMTGANL
jgi:hypothetical protein